MAINIKGNLIFLPNSTLVEVDPTKIIINKKSYGAINYLDKNTLKDFKDMILNVFFEIHLLFFFTFCHIFVNLSTAIHFG